MLEQTGTAITVQIKLNFLVFISAELLTDTVKESIRRGRGWCFILKLYAQNWRLSWYINCFKVHLNVFKSKKLIKLAMEIDTVNSVLK